MLMNLVLLKIGGGENRTKRKIGTRLNIYHLEDNRKGRYNIKVIKL